MQQILVQHLHWTEPFPDPGERAMNAADKNPCPNGSYTLVSIMICSKLWQWAAEAGLDLLSLSLVTIPLSHNLGKHSLISFYKQNSGLATQIFSCTHSQMALQIHLKIFLKAHIVYTSTKVYNYLNLSL